MIFLGKLRHPHLVKLIGYCCEDEERLLVYEFMPRGSLENHEANSLCSFMFVLMFSFKFSINFVWESQKGMSVALPWNTRLKVAIGAARGLAFLQSV